MFEALMQQFVGCVVTQSGNVGIHVVRTEGSRDYTVFDRFASMEDRRRFMDSAEYIRWMERLGEVSVERPRVDEIEGLAFWFTLPDEPGHHPPSKMKMFLLAVLGVYPLRILLVTMIRPLTPQWPPLLRELLIAIPTVAALTWVVMPNPSRPFKKGLSAPQQGDGRPG